MPRFCVIQQLDKPGQIVEAEHYEFYQGRLNFFTEKRQLITTFSARGWLQIYEVKADESKSAENYDDSWAYEHNPRLHGYTDKG